jgi:hypothetical protein
VHCLLYEMLPTYFEVLACCLSSLCMGLPGGADPYFAGAMYGAHRDIGGKYRKGV